MKTAEVKSSAAQAKSNTPFFSKESEPGFFGSSLMQNSFFRKPNSRSSIQGKLNVGKPNDPYEKEADSMADKVVQRLGDSQTVQRKSDSNIPAPEPFIRLSPITPFVQSKCDHCEEEEKLRKKEDEENGDQSKKLLKKPIFDSDADAPKEEKENVQMKCTECEEEEKINKRESEKESEHDLQTKPIFESTTFANQHGTDPVQMKCAECEKEEKLQKKEGEEEENIQTKPIFDSEAVMSADPGANVQLKCAECEKEESLQKKNDQEAEKKKDESGLIQSKGENEINHQYNSSAQLKSEIFLSTANLQTKSIHVTTNTSGLDSNISTYSVNSSIDTSSIQSSTLQKLGTEEEKPEKEDEEPVQKAPIKEATTKAPDEDEENSQSIQKKCAECEKEEKMQKKESDSSGDSVSASVESQLSSSRGSGSPLPKETRSQMESSFGADFSNVRVHSDSRAVEMSKNLHAQAFTSGSDIYFNQGKYDTGTQSGQHLLAHELTHTLQQGSSTIKRVPDIQKDDPPASSTVNTDDLAKTVYDALHGWTTSGDSQKILNAINNKSKSITDEIVKKTADKANDSVIYVFEWMNSDMVTSDWKAILSHFINVKAYMIEGMIGRKLYDLLWGYTSDSDSEEIMSTLVGTTPVTGELLDKCMTQLEAKGNYGFEYASEKLFGDMKATDAIKLMQHFFNSGGDYSVSYAEHWMAYKIKALLSGATSIDDSQAIVRNFEWVPQGRREHLLYALDKMFKAEGEKTISEQLMTDMQEEDYVKLKGLVPILPVYDPTFAYNKWGWRKFVNFLNYVEGGIESILCGVVGVILGVLSVITDIIGAVIDIVIAAKDIVGMVVYYASLLTGNPICRESKEKVFAFFKGIGDFFGAPGDAIGKMWDNLLEESKVIEGPFEECKNAIFWTTKIANFLVNLILIIFAGYGAVKLALEGIEALVNVIRAGEFLLKLKQLPGKLLEAIKGLPSKAADAIARNVAKVVKLLKNPAKLMTVIRGTISTIRLAATDREFFIFLREQATEAAKKSLQSWKDAQKEFWTKRKDFWTKEADKVAASADAVDEKLVSAADTVADDQAKAENIANDAEKSADSVNKEADDLKDDIATTGGEGTQPFESKLPENWREGSPERPPRLSATVTRMRGLGISDDNIIAIINNAALAKDYDPALFFGDLNRFVINFEALAGRPAFDVIIAGLTSKEDFTICRMLLTQVSNGQNIMEIMNALNLSDISKMRPFFTGPDKDFINKLTKIVTRVKGNSADIFLVLQDSGNDPDKLLNALDRLGEGKYTPAEVRDSLAFEGKLEKAIAEGADGVAKEIWGEKLELDADGKPVKDAKGTYKLKDLSADKSGDLASAYIRKRRDIMASFLLNGGQGTEIDSIRWGMLKEILTNNELPTIVKNDLLGEAWSFTKAKQYTNMGYEVIREVSFRVLGADGLPTGEEARLDAVLKKGDQFLYKEFKSSATADVSKGQDKVYDLMSKGATKQLEPYGPNAEKAFGQGMKQFNAKKVDIERP
ncbi:MAG: hypothetical protein C5B52_17440 [Bacteroidetes bacterium]|nr:MAG: hypothetical protein C5B52_17440 [Bacteroidota bacterium]